jgi:hypothetical protein
MAPLPQPGHNGCTDQQDQEIRTNPLLGRNVNSLHYLYRLPRQPNTPEMRSRSSRPFSAAEQDNFLADTLSAAWQLALESQAYFDNDSSNHTAISTTTATTTTTTMATTTSGRQNNHNNTDLDHHDDSGDNNTDLDHHEDSDSIPSMQ